MNNKSKTGKDNKESDIKIAVLGQSLVGKSALTYRFINNMFPTDHDTTIEDTYRFKLNIDGKDYLLEILDTAGQDDYQAMLNTWINAAEGFLLVYAINDADSFSSLKTKYEAIQRNKKSQNLPINILVVGNKCDLTQERKVSASEARNLCNSWDAKFIEASALTHVNVIESFEMISRDIVLKRLEKKTPEKEEQGSCNFL